MIPLSRGRKFALALALYFSCFCYGGPLGGDAITQQLIQKVNLYSLTIADELSKLRLDKFSRAGAASPSQRAAAGGARRRRSRSRSPANNNRQLSDADQLAFARQANRRPSQMSELSQLSELDQIELAIQRSMNPEDLVRNMCSMYHRTTQDIRLQEVYKYGVHATYKHIRAV
eukprot:Lankesteria_metandrocarpae@DN5241_c3_g1_i7.p1